MRQILSRHPTSRPRAELLGDQQSAVTNKILARLRWARLRRNISRAKRTKSRWAVWRFNRTSRLALGDAKTPRYAAHELNRVCISSNSCLGISDSSAPSKEVTARLNKSSQSFARPKIGFWSSLHLSSGDAGEPSPDQVFPGNIATPTARSMSVAATSASGPVDFDIWRE